MPVIKRYLMVKENILKQFGMQHLMKTLFRKKSMPTMPIGEWIKGPLKGWAYDRLNNLIIADITYKAQLASQ